MSDEIKVQSSQLWELHDRLQVLQHAPVVTDPETGKQVDPTNGYLCYGWIDGKWHLIDAGVIGPEINEDGSYENNEIDCHFYDPVAGDAGNGQAPQWLIDKANKRMSRLPDMPDPATFLKDSDG